MMLFMLPPLYVCVCSEIPHLSPCIMIPISITFASELYSVLLEKKEIINDKVPIFFLSSKIHFTTLYLLSIPHSLGKKSYGRPTDKYLDM